MKEIRIWFCEHYVMKQRTLSILKKRYRIIIDKKAPRYVFCSSKDLDIYRYRDAVRICYEMENLVPDFSLSDYAMGNAYLTFEDRYLRVTDYMACEQYRTDLELAARRHLEIVPGMAERKFCCMVVSNGTGGDDFRNRLFHALSEYKRVDSGGRYGNNIGLPQGVADKLAFQKQYKFVIACENSSSPGYTTEKIVQGFSAGAVPIYWGNPRIEEEFHGKAFVNAHRFRAMDEVVREVAAIDKDPARYLRMLEEPAFAVDIKQWEQAVEQFLWHIFDQEWEEAFRRNRVFWGRMYEKRRNIGDAAYNAIHKTGMGMRTVVRKITRKPENCVRGGGFLKIHNLKKNVFLLLYQMPAAKYMLKILTVCNLICFYWQERRRVRIRRNAGNRDTVYILRGKNDGNMKGLAARLYEVVSAVYECEQHGYRLFVDYEKFPCQYSVDRKIHGVRNAWEYYFDQPFHLTPEEAYGAYRVIYSGWSFRKHRDDAGRLVSRFDRLPALRQKQYVSRIMIKEHILDKVMELEKKMFAGRKVLGVLVRGTDYVIRKPANHPVQPSVSQVMEKMEEYLSAYPIDRIFLVTEDEEIFRKMKDVYGKRVFCSDYHFASFHPDRDVWLADCFTDDPYERGFRYLVRLLLLCGCDYFIGGRTTGSRFVLDRAEFLEKYVFDLGVY